MLTRKTLPVLVSCVLLAGLGLQSSAQDSASAPAFVPASAPATAPASAPATSPASQPAEPTTRSTTGTRPIDFLPAETINARISQLQDAKDVAGPDKAKAMDLYNQALNQVKLRDDYQAKADKFSADSAGAAALLADLKAKLETPDDQTPASGPSDANLPQLEQALRRAETQQTAARNEVAALAQEAKFRDERRNTEIPQSLDSIRNLLAEVAKQASAAPTADEPAAIAQARKTLLQAQEQMLKVQRTSLFRERRSYDDRNDVLTAQKDLAGIRLSQSQKLVVSLRDMVDAKRKAQALEASRKAEETARKFDQKAVLLSDIARENARLAQQRTDEQGPTSSLKAVTDELAQAGDDLTRIVNDFKSVSERVDAGGVSQAVYLLLRRQQDSLPQVDLIQKHRKTNQELIEQIRMSLFELDDKRTAAIALKANPPKELAGSDHQEERQQLSTLLMAQLDIIDSLKADYTTYLTRLGDLDLRQKRLIDETTRFRQYIGEHVLWVRSTTPLGWQDLPQAGKGLGWLTSAQNWRHVGCAASKEISRNWPVLLLIMTPLAMLLLLRRRFVRRLDKIGDQSTHGKLETIGSSLTALALTLLIALPLPLALLLAGWRLGNDPEIKPFASDVAAGLVGLAVVFMPLELLRQVCRKHGLAEAHFRWPAASLQSFRHWIGLLQLALLPFVFVIVAAHQQSERASGIVSVGAMGRLAFLLVMVAISTFILLLLRPSGAILASTMREMKDSWLGRAQVLWYSLAVLTPLLLATAAVLGYYYAAMHLSHRLLETVVLIVLLIVLHSLMTRWISLARRHLAVERLRKLAAVESAPGASAGASDALSLEVEDEIALTTVGAQSRQFGRYLAAAILIVGGWLIWSDVLPALGILRSVELWSHIATVSQTTIGPDGTATTAAVERLVPITLADLLSAIGVAVLVVAASRNLPGLMEITILRRLKWDFGSRYAFVTILRYIIIVAGTVIVFGMVGVKWSSIQWLVAAITVGLGFGLQEIFANFISGLILLFERPMRVGDMVTVGEVTGTVSRIRIRATTITDMDRKELIVPNKEFITGKLMNWTLSDTILRVVIPVGVNYDADTPKVLALLKKLANEHPDALKDPPPQAMFMGFGDSALNFEVRVFAKNYELFHKIRNEMHTRILEAFRKEGIQIPFPQREIHLRTEPDTRTK